MMKAKLPWLFTALAVASPVLLYVLFTGGFQRDLDPTGLVFWSFYSIILMVVFVGFWPICLSAWLF